MKLNLLFNFLIVLFFTSACGDAKKTKEKQLTTSDSVRIDDGNIAVPENVSSPLSETNPLLGSYVGDFTALEIDEKKSPSYFNRINITLDSVVNDMLYGHSVVAGNIRPFKGTISQKDKIYATEVKEPGNDKYDGVFTFTVLIPENKINGSWTANDKKLAVTKRKYSLSKKMFQYNPQQELELNGRYSLVDPTKSNEFESEFITEDAGKFNASAVTLVAKDIENMYKRDLEVMRNAIYARHGYSFKNRIMRYFFDSEIAWYIPVSTDVSKELTELEKKNIALIKSYEDYASAYYDTFGR